MSCWDKLLWESAQAVVRFCLKTGGEGANAAIDPIGGKMTGQLVKSLAKGGKYVLYGALAQGEPCQVGKAVAKAW